jgi:hypoxanthine phosphoribosyltransferase
VPFWLKAASGGHFQRIPPRKGRLDSTPFLLRHRPPDFALCLNILRIPSTIRIPPSGSFNFAFWSSIVTDLKVLFTREQISRRVTQIGEKITIDYAGEPVVLIGVLKGAAIFLSDLSRAIHLEATFDFISVSSYGNGKQNSGEVKLLKDVDQSMEGKNIILVEDILDTGLTLSYLSKILWAKRPKSLRIAALLDKAPRRQMPIHADYVGFEIPDEFVVGYGMDYAEKYRNLPDICIVP